MAKAGSRSALSRGHDRGIAAEYRAIRDLVKAGYIVTHAAGSHGPFDMIALAPGRIRCIQVKAVRDALPRSELDALAVLAKMMPPGCTVELWHTWFRKKSFEVTVF
jgi:hypothetical protein